MEGKVRDPGYGENETHEDGSDRDQEILGIGTRSPVSQLPDNRGVGNYIEHER